MKQLLYMSLVLLFLSGSLYAKGGVEKVSAIHFKGLETLSKYELVSNVKTGKSGDGILIDVDSLREQLKKNTYIDAFSIKRMSGILTVTIKERKVAYIIGIYSEKTTDLFEFDEQFGIVSKNRARNHFKPVVYFSDSFFEKSHLNHSARRFLRLIDSVEKIYSTLFENISDIYFGDMNIRLSLHNRKTTFILKATRSNFDRLHYIVGYLDRIKYYPDRVEINSNKIVLR